MSEPVNTKLFEVIFGKIQLKSTLEIFNASFKFVSTQGGNGTCLSFKICYCRHLCYL